MTRPTLQNKKPDHSDSAAKRNNSNATPTIASTDPINQSMPKKHETVTQIDDPNSSAATTTTITATTTTSTTSTTTSTSSSSDISSLTSSSSSSIAGDVIRGGIEERGNAGGAVGEDISKERKENNDTSVVTISIWIEDGGTLVNDVEIKLTDTVSNVIARHHNKHIKNREAIAIFQGVTISDWSVPFSNVLSKSETTQTSGALDESRRPTNNLLMVCNNPMANEEESEMRNLWNKSVYLEHQLKQVTKQRDHFEESLNEFGNRMNNGRKAYDQLQKRFQHCSRLLNESEMKSHHFRTMHKAAHKEILQLNRAIHRDKLLSTRDMDKENTKAGENKTDTNSSTEAQTSGSASTENAEVKELQQRLHHLTQHLQQYRDWLQRELCRREQLDQKFVDSQAEEKSLQLKIEELNLESKQNSNRHRRIESQYKNRLSNVNVQLSSLKSKNVGVVGGKWSRNRAKNAQMEIHRLTEDRATLQEELEEVQQSVCEKTAEITRLKRYLQKSHQDNKKMELQCMELRRLEEENHILTQRVEFLEKHPIFKHVMEIRLTQPSPSYGTGSVSNSATSGHTPPQVGVVPPLHRPQSCPPEQMLPPKSEQPLSRPPSHQSLHQQPCAPTTVQPQIMSAPPVYPLPPPTNIPSNAVPPPLMMAIDPMGAPMMHIPPMMAGHPTHSTSPPIMYMAPVPIPIPSANCSDPIPDIPDPLQPRYPLCGSNGTLIIEDESDDEFGMNDILEITPTKKNIDSDTSSEKENRPNTTEEKLASSKGMNTSAMEFVPVQPRKRKRRSRSKANKDASKKSDKTPKKEKSVPLNDVNEVATDDISTPFAVSDEILLPSLPVTCNNFSLLPASIWSSDNNGDDTMWSTVSHEELEERSLLPSFLHSDI